MSLKGAVTTAILAGLILGSLAAYWRGGRERYMLPAGKSTLDQETRRLELEYPLAATKKPYLILDLPDSRLDYRLSGMTLKSIPFQIDSIQKQGKPGRLIRGENFLLEIEDRGAPLEVIVPPDPNQPVDPLKDPKLFPPDPPTDFTMLFDHPVKVRFLGTKVEGWKERFQGVGRAVRGWLPWGRGSGKGEIRIQLSLPASQAQEIYRALYRHENVLVLGLSAGPGGDAPGEEASSSDESSRFS
jgi:hypothetical protein